MTTIRNSLRIFVRSFVRRFIIIQQRKKVLCLQNDIKYIFSPINCIRLQLVVYPVEQSSRIKRINELPAREESRVVWVDENGVIPSPQPFLALLNDGLL